MDKKTNILLIYTGGTIGMVKEYGTGVLLPFNFDTLLEKIPELKQLECNIDSVSFDEPIDSSNMNPEYWREIVIIIEERYNLYDGFVVLHGSDTMSYTSSAISFMLENLSKPVIFTGSQLPIGDLRTDAKENLITSIQIAALREENMPVIQEVCLYFEYKLYRANRTTKVNSENFKAFASLNYPYLIESGVHLKINYDYLRRFIEEKKLVVHKKMDSNVVILKLFPGLQEKVLESVLNIPNLKTLVIETYGAGNASTEEWLVKSLKKAIGRGLYIINVTQCSGGSVIFGKYETSAAFRGMQVITGKDITTEAAITKAMYLLGCGVSGKTYKTMFETSLRGEMN